HLTRLCLRHHESLGDFNKYEIIIFWGVFHWNLSPRFKATKPPVSSPARPNPPTMAVASQNSSEHTVRSGI
ncbi:MAG: hypothetical protein OTI35_19025, partial [Sulfitobacter sp.]|nr:hypothetical protein [Sulfitobacter sp.]